MTIRVRLWRVSVAVLVATFFDFSALAHGRSRCRTSE
jgi:hypothetical protein